MRLIFALSFCVLCSSFALADDDYDIEIMSVREVVDFHFDYWTYQPCTLKRTNTISREIKVNTYHGLEEVKTLYIPVPEYRGVEHRLVEVTARTVKADGTTTEVTLEEVKETTLPANDRNLFGVTGKVKLFAFPNVELGDRIFYEYITESKWLTSTTFPTLSTREYISSTYPIHQATYVFTLSSNTAFAGYFGNYDTTFFRTLDGGKIRYAARINNIPPLSDESNHSKSSEAIFFDYEFARSSAMLTKGTLKSKLYLVGKKASRQGVLAKYQTVNMLRKSLGKETPPSEKIAFLRKNVSADYLNSAPISALLAENDMPNFKEVRKWHGALQQSGMDCNIIAVRGQSSGKINPRCPSLEQFETFFIEYDDENGNTHYYRPLVGFAELDDVPSRYFGTQAARIRWVGKKRSVEFFEFPYLNNDTKRHKAYQLTLQQQDDHIAVATTRNVTASGQYRMPTYPEFKQQLLHDSLETFGRGNIDYVESRWSKCSVDTVVLKPQTDPNTIEWSDEFTFELPHQGTDKQQYIDVFKIIESRFWVSHRDRQPRKMPANLGVSGKRTYAFTMVPPPGWKWAVNELLNSSSANAIASFESSCSIAANGALELAYSYHQIQPTCTPDQWPEYVAVRDVAHRFTQQKLLLVKQ